MKNKKQNLLFSFIPAVLFIGLLIYLSIRYGPELTKLVSDPQKFREYLLSFGPLSAVVFMLFQVLQVVIAVIPGEPVQIAGGYLFGVFWGTVYSIVGITAGYIIVFIAVKLFGFPLVKKLVPEKELQKFYALINNSKFEVTIFLLFLIPGIPKDMLVYIAGLTPIKPVWFFVIITIARTPAMIGSSFIGSSIQTGDYRMVIIISVAASILFLIGFLFKDKIIDFIHARLQKKDHQEDDRKDKKKP